MAGQNLRLSGLHCKMADRSKVSSAREAMETLTEISKLLNTGLDSETLAICVKLCEAGVNPEALASVVQELRRETAALQNADEEEQRK
ncbi:mitotic-spindle organizing protein 1-like [Actinia tenebrosa]|uniref:Mitotic-spindle organizing protein 1-like n=1 Tax=Actinia tenebrosa TaxID=6105 RepID=A0A6P8J032_ACTTE|nr:mitotic-spindle organizing protein 1-like [Actinia tenebrosa]